MKFILFTILLISQANSQGCYSSNEVISDPVFPNYKYFSVFCSDNEEVTEGDEATTKYLYCKNDDEKTYSKYPLEFILNTDEESSFIVPISVLKSDNCSETMNNNTYNLDLTRCSIPLNNVNVSISNALGSFTFQRTNLTDLEDLLLQYVQSVMNETTKNYIQVVTSMVCYFSVRMD